MVRQLSDLYWILVRFHFISKETDTRFCLPIFKAIKSQNSTVKINKLTAWRKICHEWLSRTSYTLPCMQLEVSLPRSLRLATGPYRSLLHSVHTFTPYFCDSNSHIFFHLLSDDPQGFFPSGFPTKIVYIFIMALIRATWHAHLTPPPPPSLNALIMFG
jgi:hypothetical protein